MVIAGSQRGGCSCVSCQRGAQCLVSIRDHLNYQQGTGLPTSSLWKNPQPVFFFHLIPTGWFLYLPHWLPKLETWLKMNWLRFNPVKMNAQDWSTIEAGRDSFMQILSSCSFRGQKVTIVWQSVEMANIKGLWIKPSEFKSWLHQVAG